MKRRLAGWFDWLAEGLESYLPAEVAAFGFACLIHDPGRRTTRVEAEHMTLGWRSYLHLDVGLNDGGLVISFKRSTKVWGLSVLFNLHRYS